MLQKVSIGKLPRSNTVCASASFGLWSLVFGKYVVLYWLRLARDGPHRESSAVGGEGARDGLLSGEGAEGHLFPRLNGQGVGG